MGTREAVSVNGGLHSGVYGPAEVVPLLQSYLRLTFSAASNALLDDARRGVLSEARIRGVR